MSWTTPTVRATGDLITASIYNADIVNDLLALRGSAVGRKSGFNNGALISVTLDTVVYDDMSMLSTVNAYQTVPWAGRFEAFAYVDWTTATGTGSCQVAVYRYNSSGVNQEDIGGASTSVLNGHTSCGGIANFASGDRVVVAAANSASGSAGVLAVRLSVMARG